MHEKVRHNRGGNISQQIDKVEPQLLIYWDYDSSKHEYFVLAFKGISFLPKIDST